MTTETKQNKPNDSRDKLVTSAVGSGDTADNNASLTNKAEDNKPTVYKATPVCIPQGKNGHNMPTFVLKQVPGVIQPKLNQSVCFKFGNKTFVGVVKNINPQGVIALNLANEKES